MLTSNTIVVFKLSIVFVHFHVDGIDGIPLAMHDAEYVTGNDIVVVFAPLHVFQSQSMSNSL